VPTSRAKRLLRVAGFAVYTTFAVTVLLFGFFEIFPGAIAPCGLESIRYLALRSRYVPDPDLVVVPRRTSYRFQSLTHGDLYSPALGVEAPWIRGDATFNEHGFRANSAPPPYDVLVLGDSFVGTGETDSDTLSERLRSLSGLATYNLGRGWYGPPQYVTLLRRFGPELRPRWTLLCLFEGNDLEDIRQYARWSEGGSYYDFSVLDRNVLARYGIALRDTGRLLGGIGRDAWRRAAAADPDGGWRTHPRVGVIPLEGRDVIMRFDYVPERSLDDLRREPDPLPRLRSALAEFRSLSLAIDSTPVVVLIPTKFQVYAPLAGPTSSAAFLALVRERGQGGTLAHDAVTALAAELALDTIDLLPVFRDWASHGDLLYHPFDTHWTSFGRQIAAETIAARLRKGVAATP
jgi:acetyltransferase AlgX (SGNH hydrolase-like protein)